MLKGISPLLNADLLHALKSMGHGDVLILSDANFPSASVAANTVLGKPLHIDASTAAQATAAILSLMPLDTFIDTAAVRMEVVGHATEVPPVQKEVQAAIDHAEGKHWPLKSVDRFAFYELAKKAFCVVQTGERRFYGCFAFTKGVIGPDANKGKTAVVVAAAAAAASAPAAPAAPAAAAGDDNDEQGERADAGPSRGRRGRQRQRAAARRREEEAKAATNANTNTGGEA
jgi:L-fucose mutarotase